MKYPIQTSIRTFFINLSFLLILPLLTYSFHDGGVAACKGCHIMHNSQDGQVVDINSPGGNEYQLIMDSPTDLCLSCHANDNGAVFGDDPLNPPPLIGAGNFVFLLEENINDAPNGATNPIFGDAAGHNVLAPSKGIIADPNYITSPGGTFPPYQLECTSCHDPHGNSSYRMLNSSGPIQGGSFTFMYDAPIAEGIDLNSSESQSNHNAYISGMSEWCGNCHGHDYHDQGGGLTNFEHPSLDNFNGAVTNRYNVYNGTNDFLGGSFATAYLPEIPFEDASNTITKTDGSSMSSRVMCLSCHRAHASSAPRAGRWDFYVAYLQDDGAVSGSYQIPNPYTNTQQEPLCKKCHPQNVTLEIQPVLQ